ncbi:MAG: choice-of-anchor Q domain-containing protein [Solirubrobacterales bacterium]
MADLYNVTAVASQTFGLLAFATNGQNVQVNVHNSIINSPTTFDVFAQSAESGKTATVDLDFSNYADKGTQVSGSPSDASVTDPATASNVMAAPIFADTDPFFHQAAGSPTIDKGSASFASSLDIDGGARTVGSAPDIGADEFVPPTSSTTPPPAGPTPTSTTSNSNNKKKKCKKKHKKGKHRKRAAKAAKCKKKEKKRKKR